MELAIQPSMDTKTTSATKAMTDHSAQGAGSLVPTIESPNRQTGSMAHGIATIKQSKESIIGNKVTIETLLNPSVTQPNLPPTPKTAESPQNSRIGLKDGTGKSDNDTQYLPIAAAETTLPPPQRKLGLSVTETPAGTQSPSRSLTPNSAFYTYVIQSRDNRPAPRQAPRNCWSHLLPFPTTGTKIENRDDKAWLPFLKALGLTQNEFPAIQVDGMKPQTGNAGNENIAPSWNFLIYVLIAVSPRGKLESREIYHLCLAWCPRLDSKNQSCRASLTKKDEFRHEDDFHRLSWIGEPPSGKKREKEDEIKAEGLTVNQPTLNKSAAKEQSGKAPTKKTPAPKLRSKMESTANESAPEQPPPQSSGSSRSSNSPPPQILLKRSTVLLERKSSDSRASDNTVQDHGGPGPRTKASRKRRRSIPQPRVDNKDKEPQLDGDLSSQGEAQVQIEKENETARRTTYSVKKGGKIVTYRKMGISQWKEEWSKEAALQVAYAQDPDGDKAEREFLSPLSPAPAPASKRTGPFIEPPRLDHPFATGCREPKSELEVMFSNTKYRAMMGVSASNSRPPSASMYYSAEEWARLWELEKRRMKFDRSHKQSQLILGLES